jgi:ATP-dependent Lon protease
MPAHLPVLPLINTVVFPQMTVPLLVEMPATISAVGAAPGDPGLVLLVAQRRENLARVLPDDLYHVGTIAQVVQSIRVPNGGLQVVVKGTQRARVLACTSVDTVTHEPSDPPIPDSQPDQPEIAPAASGEDEERPPTGPGPTFLRAAFEPVGSTYPRTLLTEALMRTVIRQLEQLVERGRAGHPDILSTARQTSDPGWLADVAAFAPDLTVAQRQGLLEVFDPTDRLRAVSKLLGHHLDIVDLRNRIQGDIHKGMEKSQKEYLLREQIKAIHRELGEGDPQQTEIEALRQRIEHAGMPAPVKERATREVDRLPLIPAGSPETGIVRTYVDWLLSLPWSNETPDALDMKAAELILDEDHYGLEKVKERIVEFLAVRRLSGKLRSPILCLAGPPGVGKTSLGRSIARAMGRTFVRISLGGVRDEAEIRGHRRTYVGAMPGRILRGMRDAGARNPVFMLDEIDKIGRDFRGDPSSALLEVLDPEQNAAFSDHYLEAPFDLSRVLFITTANLLDPIPAALRDRMEIIQVPGYTEEEKVQIASRFILPRQLEQHGVTPDHLAVGDDVLRAIIQGYTREAGVRNLDRQVATICRKVARRVAESDATTGDPTAVVQVRADDLAPFLGPVRFDGAGRERHDEAGVAYGLAVTETGGDIIEVEATWVPGRTAEQPALVLTGQLGDVMQESVRAAFSYVRGRAPEFGIASDWFETHGAHVHVPAGGQPKDGPSAGITMTTAIASALTGRLVRSDIAMTGEVTLRGKVLAIGGVKQKALAAHRAGIKVLVLPRENRKDLEEIPADVRSALRIVWVDDVDAVLKLALRPRRSPPSPAAAREGRGGTSPLSRRNGGGQGVGVNHSPLPSLYAGLNPHERNETHGKGSGHRPWYDQLGHCGHGGRGPDRHRQR